MPQHKQRSRAGEAFAAILKDDPKTQAAWGRAQSQLQAFSMALRTIGPSSGQLWAVAASFFSQAAAEAQRQHQPELTALLDQVRTQIELGRREWESLYGEPAPRDLCDWERLAVRAELDANQIYRGDWTLAKAEPIIQGYLLRLRDAARLLEAKQAMPAEALRGIERAVRESQHQPPKPTSDVPQSKEIAWDMTDHNFESTRALLRQFDPQPLTEKRASQICRPDGPVRYMRKKGLGCRIHIEDFRAYLRTRGLKDDARAVEQAIEFVTHVEAMKRQVREAKD